MPPTPLGVIRRAGLMCIPSPPVILPIRLPVLSLVTPPLFPGGECTHASHKSTKGGHFFAKKTHEAAWGSKPGF